MTDHPLDEPTPFRNCPSVELTDEQIGRANRLAEQMGYKLSNNETFDIKHRNFTGMSGELAFAKYYDLEFTGYIENGGDDGWEYKVMGKNKILTVDVKTRTYPEADLLIHQKKYNRLSNYGELPDAYCLIEKRLHLFGIVGFMWSEDVTDYEIYPAGEYSPVPVYFIPREELRTPPDPEELEDVTN